MSISRKDVINGVHRYLTELSEKGQISYDTLLGIVQYVDVSIQTKDYSTVQELKQVIAEWQDGIRVPDHTLYVHGIRKAIEVIEGRPVKDPKVSKSRG